MLETCQQSLNLALLDAAYFIIQLSYCYLSLFINIPLSLSFVFQVLSVCIWPALTFCQGLLFVLEDVHSHRSCTASYARPLHAQALRYEQR